jgi:hypothetical protein
MLHLRSPSSNPMYILVIYYIHIYCALYSTVLHILRPIAYVLYIDVSLLHKRLILHGRRNNWNSNRWSLLLGKLSRR